MRRPLLLLTAGLLGLAVAPVPQPPASASCAAPYLEHSDHLTLRRGATSTLEGVAFVDGCQDSMSCSAVPGCDSCEYEDPPPQPYDNVRLRLVQGRHTWLLDVADAGTAADDRLGKVTWAFEVPADVEKGRARLRADHADAVHVRIG